MPNNTDMEKNVQQNRIPNNNNERRYNYYSPINKVTERQPTVTESVPQYSSGFFILDCSKKTNQSNCVTRDINQKYMYLHNKN